MTAPHTPGLCQCELCGPDPASVIVQRDAARATASEMAAQVVRLTAENEQLRAELKETTADLNEQVDYTGQQIDLLDAERARVQAVRDLCDKVAADMRYEGGLFVRDVRAAIGDGDDRG